MLQQKLHHAGGVLTRKYEALRALFPLPDRAVDILTSGFSSNKRCLKTLRGCNALQQWAI